MALKALTKQYRELINDSTQTSTDELLINPDWGKITFGGCRPEPDRTYSTLNQFKLLPLDLLPDGSTQQTVSTPPPAKQTIDQIRCFSIESGNPTRTCEELISQASSSMQYVCTFRTLSVQRGICSGTSMLTRSVDEAGQSSIGARRVLPHG